MRCNNSNDQDSVSKSSPIGELGWGILGIASTARAYWEALCLSHNSRLVAVASRDIEKCRLFISECQSRAPTSQPPRAYGTYDALLEDPVVNAVYIPLPTGIRKKWVIRAAEAGKHVICEKPCAIDMDDLREMVLACKRNNVQFMDGVMFMHDKRQSALEQTIRDPAEFGSLTRITASVGFCAAESLGHRDIRYQPDLEPHGTLGDDGWYAIRLALWAMQEELPQFVIGRTLGKRPALSPDQQFIAEFSGELFFRGGVSSVCYCSQIGAPQQWAQICGTKSYIDLPDFVSAIPDKKGEITFSVRRGFSMPPFQVHRLPQTRELPLETLVTMLTNFATKALSGELEAEWPRRSLRTQLVLDACYRSALQDSVPIEIDDGKLKTLLTAE